MQLYGSYTSPFVRHCRIALMQNDMGCDFVTVDMMKNPDLSPTSKVPFMQDGALTLTDSSSILKYIREKAGQMFLADVQDYETFAISNTLLDSAINTFLLEMQGVDANEVPYLTRQKNRVASGLAALNLRIDPAQGISTDGALRAACLLAWGDYRSRFTLDGLDNLQGLKEAANADSNFVATAPPPL